MLAVHAVLKLEFLYKLCFLKLNLKTILRVKHAIFLYNYTG